MDGRVNQRKNLFVNVVPLRYLPRNALQEFTYQAPISLSRNISTGSHVLIDFRRRKALGVVRSINESAPANIKTLDIKAVLPYPPLTQGQQCIIGLLEDYYCASRTLAYKTVVPRFAVGGQAEDKFFFDANTLSHSSLRQAGEFRQQSSFRRYGESAEIPRARSAQALRALLCAKKKITLTGALYDPRHSLFVEYIQRCLRRGGQVLCLFPDLDSLHIAAEAYKRLFGQAMISVWSAHLPKRAIGREWLRISLGQAKIIISTRSGVSLPLTKLQSIILFDESDDSYKSWDQQPYYDARFLAEQLAVFLRIPYLTTRPVPPLRACSGQKVYSKILVSKSDLSIIDRKIIKHEGSKSSFPQAIIEVLERTSARAPCLVFINRLGQTALLCADCDHLLFCQNCRAYLAVISKKSQTVKLICRLCGRSQAVPDICPRCRGTRFRNFRIGAEKIYKELSACFPHKRIEQLDSTRLHRRTDIGQILDNVRRGQADIVVSSSMILSRLWSLPKFENVVALCAETLFLAPHWRVNEAAIEILHKLWSAAGKHFYVETNMTSHPVLRALNADSLKTFYQRELRDRKRFNYPPYARLIRLTAKKEDAALDFFKEINKYKIESAIIPWSKRAIMLKMPLAQSPSLLCKYVGDDWKIDVDPIAF